MPGSMPVQPARLLIALAALAVLLPGAAFACGAPPKPGEPTEEALLEKGFAEDRQGHYTDAISTFRTLLTAHPESRRGRYFLANTYWRDDRNPEAQAAWEAVLRMNPRDERGAEARDWLTRYGATTGAAVSTLNARGAGFADGPLAKARFSAPSAIAKLSDGTLVVADTGNHRLRAIAASGKVRTLAGSGAAGFADGPAGAAKLTAPTALAVDPVDNIYFCEAQRVRFVTPDGRVGTLAGGAARGYADGGYGKSRLDRPQALATDADGNVYVADQFGAVIRVVTPQGDIRRLAGSSTPGYADGAGLEARFKRVSALAWLKPGELLAVDAGARRFRRIVVASGVVSTVPGCATNGLVDGPAASAHFGRIGGLTRLKTGETYVADTTNGAIRRISAQGQVSTLAGGAGAAFADGAGWKAGFAEPVGLAMTGNGLVVVDRSAHALRLVALKAPTR